jgi:hypothetical protein
MNKDSKKHNKTESNLNETPHKSHHHKKKEHLYFYSTSKKKNLRRASLLIQTTPNLKEEKKIHNIKRNSLYKEPYKNPRNQINNIFKEKEDEAKKKVENMKRSIQIKVLCKERTKLRKILVLTRDTAALRLLSQKILRLNNKIARLIGINEGMYPYPEKKKKKIRLNNKDKDSDDEYNEYGIEEYKFDNPLLKKIRRINNYLKINEIIHDAKIIDIHTVISAIRDKPSFMFQRDEENLLFNSSTNFTNDKRKMGTSTLFSKSFHPVGFTKQSFSENEKKEVLTNSDFNDILYQLDDKNKRKYSTLSSSPKNKFKGKYLDLSPNNINDLSQINTATNSAKSRPKSTRVTFSFNKNKERNTFCLTETNYHTNSNSINNSRFITNSSIDDKNISFKNKVNEILNDTNIIKESLHRNYINIGKPKKKKADLLLKLANKLAKPKLIPKPKKKKDISQEEEYIIKLKTIPKSCKEEFRSCFKEIIYQDRILNKPDPNDVDILEEKMKYLREQQKIKEEAYQTMYLLKENIFTGKEDDEVFKEEKVFDSYGNITGLEWLIKKKYVMDDKKKLTGAFNPKEKQDLKINYPA